MAHSHDHGPSTAAAQHRGRLTATLGIVVTVMVVEVIGAAISGSLALLADAGHMLTDAAGLAIALVAIWLARRTPNDRRTFGLQRVEVLAALANGLLVSILAVVILVEGIRRIVSPSPVEGGAMLIVAVIGLMANLIGLLLLNSGKDASLNIRGAYLEVLGDSLGSVAAIAAGAVVYFTGYDRADGIASTIIGLIILPRAYSLLKDVAQVLVEGTPKGMDAQDLRAAINGIPGVLAVHDLHIWTITSGVPALSAHVVIDDEMLDPERFHHLLDEVRDCCRADFDVEHSTFQLEPAAHGDSEKARHR